MVLLIGVIDLGGTSTRWSLFDPTTKSLVADVKEVTTQGASVDALMAGFTGAAADFAAAGVSGVGVACPRPFGRSSEGLLTLHNAPHFPISQTTEFPLQAELQRLFGVSVVIKHDASCNAVAEHALGAARAWPDFALMINGTGIGYSVMKAGAVVEDEAGNGPEPCFMHPTDSPDLNVEELTSGPPIRERFGLITTDAQRAEAAEWCARWQRSVIGSLVEQYETRHLVLTGGVSQALGSFYIDALQEALAPYGLVSAVHASLKGEVGLIGAGLRFA